MLRHNTGSVLIILILAGYRENVFVFLLKKHICTGRDNVSSPVKTAEGCIAVSAEPVQEIAVVSFCPSGEHLPPGHQGDSGGGDH